MTLVVRHVQPLIRVMCATMDMVSIKIQIRVQNAPLKTVRNAAVVLILVSSARTVLSYIRMGYVVRSLIYIL